MKTLGFQADHFQRSVIAVPPLARDVSGDVDDHENKKIIRFLESAGVRSLLYGGNAAFHHISLREYSSTLQMLSETPSDETYVCPSVGPTYGFARDQIRILRQFRFPTAMLLPSHDAVDPIGIANGVRRLAEDYGKPLVLYVKSDNWIAAETIASLDRDGVLSWIKYAVVRDDPSQDEYLKRIIDVFPPEKVVSGMGEQPAIVHRQKFGLGGWTSGCVCVAPSRSMEMMRAMREGDWEAAETIRRWFEPLEDLRNEISPIRVLHHAVQAAGVACTGPLLPMLSMLDVPTAQRIDAVIRDMVS